MIKIAPQRLPTVDALRGVAILGILLMNVTSFAMPFEAYTDPRAWPPDGTGATGANGVVFRLERIFVAGKMMGLLSLLFGAGIVLRNVSNFGSHARRMFVLAAIGAAHAYLLWDGDILVAYAIAGVIVFPIRKLPADRLLLLGSLALLLVVAFNALRLVPWLPVSEADRIVAFVPDRAAIEREIVVFSGPYVGHFAERVPRVVRAQTIDLLTFTLPWVAGLMLIGMALTKLGLLTDRAQVRTRLMLAAIACPIGWTATALTGLYADGAPQDGFRRLMVANLVEPLVSGVTAVGYTALLMPLLARRSPTPLVAVGRTALSCYLAQTLICTTIFYGHGLGWFGSVDRVGQLWVVLGVWVFLLVAAPLWLTRFKLGPAEWLWRTLSRAR